MQCLWVQRNRGRNGCVVEMPQTNEYAAVNIQTRKNQNKGAFCLLWPWWCEIYRESMDESQYRASPTLSRSTRMALVILRFIYLAFVCLLATIRDIASYSRRLIDRTFMTHTKAFPQISLRLFILLNKLAPFSRADTQVEMFVSMSIRSIILFLSSTWNALKDSNEILICSSFSLPGRVGTW